jgi:hypothetical protein
MPQQTRLKARYNHDDAGEGVDLNLPWLDVTIDVEGPFCQGEEAASTS